MSANPKEQALVFPSRGGNDRGDLIVYRIENGSVRLHYLGERPITSDLLPETWKKIVEFVGAK